MFNTKEEHRVTIASGGPKTCVLRFPSDAEWCEYSSTQRVVEKSLGRGSTETESPDRNAAAVKLMEAIRIDKDGPQFDEVESRRAIAVLQDFEIIEIESAAPSLNRAAYRIRAEVHTAGLEMTITLRAPSAKEVEDFILQSAKRKTVGNITTTRNYLEPGGALFDSLFVSSTGYADNAIPITHKNSCLWSLIAHAEEEVAGARGN